MMRTQGDNNGPLPAMTTAELLEHAVIDAMGMLDEPDRDAFNRAFAASPATLKELIRAEQARVVESIDFLPDVDAPPHLRKNYLAFVREEIAKKNLPAAPAATPAQPRVVTHAAGPATRPPRLRRAPRVNPAWRVAAVALSVGVVVLATINVQLRQQADNNRDAGRMAAFMDSIGLEQIESALFSPSTERFRLSPVGDVGRACAMLMYDPQTDRARLYVLSLSTQERYTLVTLDEKDRPVETITSFTPTGVFSGYDVDLKRGGPVRVAIMSEGEDGRILFVADVRLA